MGERGLVILVRNALSHSRPSDVRVFKFELYNALAQEPSSGGIDSAFLSGGRIGAQTIDVDALSQHDLIHLFSAQNGFFLA